MGIETSMYSSLVPAQIQTPNPTAMLEAQMRISQLGMQNREMQMEMQQKQIGLQQAQSIRDAYSSNTDQSGNLDRQGFLSALGKNPYTAAMAPEYAGKFAAQDKAKAEAQQAQLKAATDSYNLTGPAFDYMAKLPEDQRAAAYPQVIQQLKDQGVDTSKLDLPYDPTLFKQYYGTWQQSKPAVEKMLTQAEIGAKNAEAALAPEKLKSEMYGSRSPNATLTDQYSADVKPIRQSQVSMNQMIDNYKNPSPQGDASLILNAFKIKFPTAPDVNSLEELSKSQAASDQWKQMATHAISGGLDQGTRDNLMRDAASTFRANYDTYQGIKQRYQARQAQQGVEDPTLTYEPAIDKTAAKVNDIQKKIGPYVPPTERGGITGAISGLASKVLGTGGSQNANANDQKQSYRKSGSSVSSDELAQYATKHGMKLSDAAAFLKGQGYAVNQ